MGTRYLQKVLSVLGEGDVLVVTYRDCPGRSLSDLANIAHEIEQAGAHLKVIEQHVDTSTAAGRAFFGMLAVFAAFETDVRRERQLEGIAMARRQEVYKGGKARLDRERVKKLADDGVGPAVTARELAYIGHEQGPSQPSSHRIPLGDEGWQRILTRGGIQAVKRICDAFLALFPSEG